MREKVNWLLAPFWSAITVFMIVGLLGFSTWYGGLIANPYIAASLLIGLAAGVGIVANGVRRIVVVTMGPI